MNAIYCDEAGNSGQNLLDPAQPYFVLASNDFGSHEAADILDVARSGQAQEIKFSALKRSPRGVARLIRVLADPRLNTSRVVANVFDKRFMVATKLIDLVMETLLHARGVDLYQRGANIAAANLMHHVLGPLCGAANAEVLLDAFVALIRSPDISARQRYCASVQRAVAACTDLEFAGFLTPFGDAKMMDEWMPRLKAPIALDPAIPALFEHIVHWGRRKPSGFRIVHDPSKPIIASEDLFRDMLADSGEASRSVGYDRRQFEFPLRATGIEYADSATHPQLQLADVCAGALHHVLRANASGTSDDLAEAIKRLPCYDWVVGAVVPTTDVTPKGNETDSDIGSNPIDPILDRLAQAKGAREG